MKNNRTRQIVMCGIFAALMGIGAFIQIPVPIIPLSLQDLFVMLAGILLGAKYGALSVVISLFIGLLGFPVFTHGGGITYVLQPSFGFMLGFIPGAYLTGMMTHREEAPGFKRIFLLPNLYLLLHIVLRKSLKACLIIVGRRSSGC